MENDVKAALSAQGEIEIAAPPGRVWSELTAIDRWSEWQPNVATARLQGDLAAGSAFRWKANGLPIVSIIRELELQRSIGWTGKSLGTKASHLWMLEALAGGGTRVVTRESMSGWLPRLLRVLAPGFLEKSLAASLQALKNRAERQYGKGSEAKS